MSKYCCCISKSFSCHRHQWFVYIKTVGVHRHLSIRNVQKLRNYENLVYPIVYVPLEQGWATKSHGEPKILCEISRGPNRYALSHILSNKQDDCTKFSVLQAKSKASADLMLCMSALGVRTRTLRLESLF